MEKVNTNTGIYPETDEDSFKSLIYSKKEFNRKIEENTGIFLQNQQIFLRNFINPLTDYKSLLVYHSTGTGKTLTSIAIAENFYGRKVINVIVKNNSLVSNFKKEVVKYYLSSKNFFCREEEKNENISNYLEIFNKNFRRYYSFTTYGSLVNKVLGLKNAQGKRLFRKNTIKFDNSLVIIDEVHNILNNDGYKAILKVLKNSQNTRLLLLSATPVYDNVKEIFEISNLLNFYSLESQLPIRNQLLKKGLIKGIEDNLLKNELEKEIVKLNSFELTEEGKRMVSKSLNNKVSYLKENEENFPVKIFKGNDKSSGFLLKTYPLSKLQEETYLKILKSSSVYKARDLENVSSIVFPNGGYTKKTYIEYLSSYKNEILIKENLKKYSSKLYNLLDLIEKQEGIIFIYANTVNYGGIDLIKKCLLSNGYSNYPSSNNIKGSFISIEENLDLEKRIKLINRLNSESNKEGKNIKIVLGSFLISEGITFRNIRHVHIFESYWNFSRIDQVIGRAIRFNSHSDLDKKDRKVRVYLHACSLKDYTSIDILKYRLSYLKDKAVKDIEYLVKKELSIDCLNNKSRNQRSNTFDYKRVCQYKKCSYTCSYNESNYIDYSTYNTIVHSKENFYKIFHILQESYSKDFTNIKDLKEIYKDLEGFKEYDILFTIDYIIKNKIVLKDYYNNNCYLYKIGLYYILVKTGNSVKTSYFNSLFDVQFKQMLLRDIVKVEGKDRRDKEKLIKVLGKLKEGSLYRVYIDKEGNEDKVFRILDYRKLKNFGDLRKIDTGKKCSYYKREELLEFLKFLGSDFISDKKNLLCDKLESMLPRVNFD